MTKAFHSLFFPAFAITISIFCLSPFHLIEANPVGFSVDLIHRDSPSSPLYNSSLSHFERVSNAFYRSTNRVKYFTLLASISPQSASIDVIPDNGEYLMNLMIGTPPFSILSIADTGSDLIWTQCMPCNDCYEQKAPLFNPKSSSTYKENPYSSRTCQTLERTSCDNVTCQYTMSYGDRSYSHGILATETVTLGSSTATQPISLPEIIFGCGHDNGGTFTDDESGIVGLGGRPVSLISQIRSSIGDKFAYCLVPLSSQNTKSSQMYFGENAIVSGNGVVSTPIIPKFPNTFYFLTLEGLTVGRQRLEFYNSSTSSPNAFGSSRSGNIIIDSGTTLTYLPPDVYSRLESAVQSEIEEEPVNDPQEILNLCYRFSNEISFPIITAHFTGADVKLSHLNAFIQTSSDVVCLAFAPANNVAILGNVAQMNFLVGYDLNKRIVSFKSKDCARD